MVTILTFCTLQTIYLKFPSRACAFRVFFKLTISWIVLGWVILLSPQKLYKLVFWFIAFTIAQGHSTELYKRWGSFDLCWWVTNKRVAVGTVSLAGELDSFLAKRSPNPFHGFSWLRILVTKIRTIVPPTSVCVNFLLCESSFRLFHIAFLCHSAYWYLLLCCCVTSCVSLFCL